MKSIQYCASSPSFAVREENMKEGKKKKRQKERGKEGEGCRQAMEALKRKKQTYYLQM